MQEPARRSAVRFALMERFFSGLQEAGAASDNFLGFSRLSHPGFVLLSNSRYGWSAAIAG